MIFFNESIATVILQIKKTEAWEYLNDFFDDLRTRPLGNPQ